MNRTAEWDSWSARRPRHDRASARLAARLADSRRAGSTRTRSPEDVAAITRMMRVELERRLSDGRLVRLGPREYELHPRVR